MDTENAGSGSPRKKVGILFVHGVGEQKRFEHLTGSVQQFAELIRQADSKAAVSIVDRTQDWKHPPGYPDPGSGAPISLSLTSEHHGIDFECHEVWWSDLGTRSGIADVILFWIWGLGQWCAPIYRDLDAAQLRKDDRDTFNKPVPKIAKIPASVAGKLGKEPLTRVQLLLVAIAAAAIGCTWGLAKRLLRSLLDQAPSPTILVQYLGDVRTYEQRAAPGDSALTDPGFPRRVGIRRRMVTEMVAMADRGFDEWYIAAHSVGTVVAYNGITEIGHTLPNYLSQQQWLTVSAKYKADPGCRLRFDPDAMMPSRPAWLEKGHVINRPLLFRNLKGFLTYGSPLNKFVALWPRVVATATDRTDANRPFADDCRWINLAAPADPVAGRLNGFPNAPGELFEGAVPSVHNISTPWTPAYGLAHILYFTGVEGFRSDTATEQKRQVMKWLINPKAGLPKDSRGTPLQRLFQLHTAYVLITIVLLALTAIAITVAGGLVSALFGGSTLTHFSSIPALLAASAATFFPMLAVSLWAILLAGQWRWFRESSLNLQLAQAERKKDKTSLVWPMLTQMNLYQKMAAAILMAETVLIGIELTAPLRGLTAWLCLIAIALVSFVCSILLQTLINRRVAPLKRLQLRKLVGGDGIEPPTLSV